MSLASSVSKVYPHFIMPGVEGSYRYTGDNFVKINYIGKIGKKLNFT
jgi:hypothetical protein